MTVKYKYKIYDENQNIFINTINNNKMLIG